MLIRWLYIPGLFYLVLVFASGAWLRWQWAEPAWTFFNAGYLTHAHSHVAVLGWAFCMLAGFLFQHAIRWDEVPKNVFRITMGALHLSIIGMAVTFTWQGYGGWSIGFSTLHMLVGYVIAVLYFKYEREEMPGVLRNFYSAAIWWLVISTIGPWLLAFGPAMPPFWMDAGIEFYLHTQFNGWLTFGVLGLALQYAWHRGFKLTQVTQWGFGLLLVGTLPALIPMLDQDQLDNILSRIGTAGSLMHAVGGLLIAGWLIRIMRQQRLSLWMGLAILTGISFIIKQIMLGIVAFPAMAELVMGYRFLVVGYLHLLLLGFISTALLAGWFRNIPGRKAWVNRSSTVAYLVGVGATLGLLLYYGACQLFGWIPMFSMQHMLLIAGLVALSGSVGLLSNSISTKPV